MRESRFVLLSLAVALVLGIAFAASGSAALLRASDTVGIVGTLWVDAIRMTVLPLIVSVIVTGVASARDLRAIGRLGGRTIATFLLMLVTLAVVAIPLTLVVFGLLGPRGASALPLPPGAADAARLVDTGPRQSAGDWLLSLVPANPLAAAAQGALLPVVVFAILFALALAASPPTARATLLGFFQALGEVMLTLVRWIILAAPVGVFALVLPLAAHAGTGFASAVGFYITAYSALSVAGTLLVYPMVAAAAGIPMRRFARAALPAQILAFTSSSSVASLPALLESAESGLALPKRVSGFVLPLAVSTFHFAAPVTWTCGAVFVAWFYGVPLGARGLAIVSFASVFLTSAAPGVPRGAFLMLAPLFSALGLPLEGIGILIALDALPDTFATALNVTGDLAAAAIVAGREVAGAP